MGSHIKIIVQPIEYPSKDDDYFIIPFDEAMIRETMAEVDEPSLDADVFTQMICTSSYIKKDIYMNREKLTKILTEEISKNILKYFYKNDTINGYTKQENKDFYRR